MANESLDRREVDQHALALPQMRKGSPSDADKPEEVGFHHSAIIVVAALFEWTEDAESRIVHQHIQPPAQQANRLFDRRHGRSEEHTSELQSLMRISYAVFCLKTQKQLKPP